MAEINTAKLRGSNRQAGRKYGGSVVIFLFLALLGLFMFLPIYLTVIMSIKPVEELFVFPPKLYAVRPTLDNFKDMFRVLHQNRVPFSRYVFNSIFVTVTVTVLQCVFSSMAAFVLAKCRFPGSKFINGVIVVALLYQSSVIYIMQYIVMAKLHMIDTYMALIFPAIASPMGLFLMRQSISQVLHARGGKGGRSRTFPHMLADSHTKSEACPHDTDNICVSGRMEHTDRLRGVQGAVQDPAHGGNTGGFLGTCQSRCCNGGGSFPADTAHSHIHAGAATGHRDHGAFGNKGIIYGSTVGRE